MSPDGSSLFVAGDSPSGSAVVSYDPGTGEERWTTQLREGSEDSLTAMAISPGGGRVFVTGPSMRATMDFQTVAVDAATGDVLWVALLDGGGPEDHPWAIATSVDGSRVYVTGYVDAGPDGGARNFATVAYDAGSGEELWLTTHDGPGGRGEVARAIGVGTHEDEGGRLRERVFITGRSGGDAVGDDRNDYATLAYDGETGALLWGARFDGTAQTRDYPLSLAVAPDHETVYVTGESEEGAGFDYVTIAYDAATGEERWINRFDRSDNDDLIPLVSFSTSPSGYVTTSPSGDRVYVTGYDSDGEYAFDWRAVTIAIDAATGDEHWSETRAGPLWDMGRHLTVSPDGGRVYLTGQAAGQAGCVVSSNDPVAGSTCSEVAGFLAASYDASNGDELSIARYGMTASDARHAATALSPDGSLLFMTGAEFGDFRTVAYRT